MQPLEEKSSRCDPVKVSLRWSIFHLCFSSIAIFHSMYALANDDYKPISRHFTRQVLSTEALRRSYEIRIGVSTLAILFSAILYYGVTKRQSVYVKAYYIYGVIHLILGILLLVFLTVWGSMHGTVDYGFVALVFIVNFLYAMILEMVRRTYLLFDTKEDHLKLVDDQYV